MEQPSSKSELLELLKEQKHRIDTNRLAVYKPYQWQVKFHNAGKDNPQRLLMAGNRTGKTYSGAFETAVHLTGEYPGWWKGRRFTRPIRVWVGGESNETTRDIVQKELFGQPDNPEVKGTGTIPLRCIGQTTRKPGVPNAYNSAMVRHVSGGYSRIGFKAYEMGFQKWMGEAVDFVWMDEEPPPEIFSQAITRTADSNGCVIMTFTPESGMTEVVKGFLNDRKEGQFLQHASWDDCPHLDEITKEQLLSVYSEHERDLRSKGIPIFGSGLVFPVSEESISVEPFDIPENWAHIAGLDFGWDHPTAVVWLAHDRDNDIVYVYDIYAESKTTPIIHAAAINARSRWVPVIWPHDGMQHDKGSGITLADQYRQQGVNMHPTHFSNPLAPGQTKGNNSVETGISDMIQRMQTGRFKVFRTCFDFFQEFKMYHRKDGKIIAKNDDILSATRYATMSLRFATTGDAPGYKDYGKKDLDYGPNNWIV